MACAPDMFKQSPPYSRWCFSEWNGMVSSHFWAACARGQTCSLLDAGVVGLFLFSSSLCLLSQGGHGCHAVLEHSYLLL
jgi:hypothetical protein